ncbi:MAG: hypothetical protein NVS3B3_06690 [Aquirhabdus sp.]
MRKVWRDLKRYERDTLGVRPRVDISLYFMQSQLSTLWSETVMNEFFDGKEAEFEAVALDNIKFLISTNKNWHSPKRKIYVKTK